jgi:hypothetical protein
MCDERVMEADKFVVRDEKGVTRCVLGRHVGGDVGLLLSDGEGRQRAYLAVAETGDLTLDCTRGEGQLACRLGLRGDVIGLTLADAQGSPRLLAGVDEEGLPAVTFLTPDMKPRVELKVTREGPGVLDLYDGAARLRLRLTIVDDDAPSVMLADEAERPRQIVMVAGDGAPALMMSDGEAPRLVATVPLAGPANLSVLDADGNVSFQTT